MVDIFDEVEEELRAERAEQFMKKYGGAMLGACLLVIAAAGGWKAWEWRRVQQDADAATRYLTAAARTEGGGVAGPDRAAAATAFEAVAADAPEGYRVLSRLRAAGLKAQTGDLAGASALWDQVAADTSADPLLRDLASLTWCLHHADQPDSSGMVEARLRPLAAPGGPWRALALEQLALLDLRLGRTDAAKAGFRKLTEDTTAPEGARGRASALLQRMGG